MAHLKGKIENILVHVDKFIFSTDFIVLDFEANKKVPIILGRPFVATDRMLIDVQKGELSMVVHDGIVTFNVFNTIKSIDDIKKFFIVSKTELLVCPELEHMLLFDLTNDEEGDGCLILLEVDLKEVISKDQFDTIELSLTCISIFSVNVYFTYF